ncbi:hypothetical protein Mal15_03290 [Stieleria maiorica]|uniref:Uncharacterized protein n=2 Tax=Stieleria maiorica TaxID=2795974 RepID=A0A5B9M5J1_9BACT|nr:hypothetical protein Mal15_03290 [Stieleria maiorica]
MPRSVFHLPVAIQLASLVIAFTANSCLADETDSEASWRLLFDSISRKYQLLREADSDDASRLQLAEGPVYVWGRPQSQGSTYGAVYVWTHKGSAEAVACLWRYVNPGGQRAIVHELHSLSPVKIRSEGDFDTWRTHSGASLLPIAGSDGQVSERPVARLQQMRTIGRNFALDSVSASGDRVHLRLLPQPFYRTQSTDPSILDGALFAFVCSVGTDPEAFLQLTAIQTDDGPRWHWSLARFSHHNLYASYKGRDVWASERDVNNPMSHNADHTYWMISQPFQPSMLEALEAREK